MKKCFLLTSFAILAICLSSCKKDSASKPKTTSLNITVQDNAGSKVLAASVQLYSSLDDWRKSSNPIASGYTDINGVVKFDSLQPLIYYWRASYDCKNNTNTASATSIPLVLNSVNIVSSILGETGTLKLSNKSANPYSLYVNGTLVQTIPGNSTLEMDNVATGSYSIRVLQNSGFVVFPTDQTFTGSLTCGSSLAATFPL